MNLLRNLLIAGLGLALLAPAGAPTRRASHLSIVNPPQLVDCAPVTLMPCMSVGVTATDDARQPAPFPVPPIAKLASALTLQAPGGMAVKPFYATSGAGQDASQHSNVILMLVDISGSMNDPNGSTSRFAAVKSALVRYVDAMQEGSDLIAIPPFESHNVVPTIRSAVFVDHKSDVLAQVNALPQPGPKNNTALFQAVFSGVDALNAELSTLQRNGRSAAELQPHLIVMTDGKNEVTPGDDRDLLNGPLGLQQAAAQVAAAHMDVVAVGFGDRAAIDVDALKRLSNRFFYAADANQLLDALHVTRTNSSHTLQMTWLLPETNRTSLAGRDQVWTPSLTLEDGSVLTGPEARMILPATIAPVYQRKALPAELVALIATHPPASSGWSTLLVHFLFFLAAGALLLVLWFWLPRLIWGERYRTPPPARWSSDRPAMTSASGVQIRQSSLPAGFVADGPAASPLQRSPAQTTQVGPRPESARTRLNFD